MRILTTKWDPNRRDLALQMPVGSRCISARMSPHGDVRAVFVAPDGDVKMAPYSLQIVIEPKCRDLPGSPGDWVHVGSWQYANGNVAHAFAPARVTPLPTLPLRPTSAIDKGSRPRRRRKRGTDGELMPLDSPAE